MADVWVTVFASVLTGLISSLGTIKALQVHIFYLRENLEDADEKLNLHEKRLTDLEIKVGRK